MKDNLLKISSVLAIFLSVMVFSASVVSAQPLFGDDPADADTGVEYIPPEVDGSVGVETPQDFIDIIINLIGWAQVFFWVIAVVMGIYAAYLYLTSAGDPGRTSRATSTLIWVAVAIVAAVLSYAIPAVVANLAGGGA
ncbi:MAG: hypothetical protein KGZ30_02285 [Anaplasmataceae bacterium]|nr:hypothetical protein [Anaplasmataceae bacterium]